VTLFWIVALVAVAAALTVIFHPNPVYSALALVVALFQMALLFFALEAPLVALLQIIVYAGAIVVLFLFVIMLLSLESDVPHPRRYGIRGVSLVLAGLLGVEVGAVAIAAGGGGAAAASPAGFGGTRALAERLFSAYMLPFELTSILLLVAVVGAVVMARRRA